jgi:DNA polymerase I
MDALFDDDLTPAAGARAAGPAPRPRPRPAPAAPVGSALLAVDGNSLAHRAFHAYRASRGGAYGFLALLAAVCDRVRPHAVVVGFDCRAGSARRERWPDYKAQRSPKDPELVTLLHELPDLVASLGVTVIIPPGWEADDVLGSAAAAAEGSAGWRCVLATSDRDAMALVSDRTSVLQLRDGMERAAEIDTAAVRRRYRVRPDQYTELAALRGDTSDNLPGILGIGPARAAALLAAYDRVAAAAEDPLGCRSVLGPDAGQALLDDLADPDRSRFHRNVDLMTIRRDLPVPVEACRLTAAPEQIAAEAQRRGQGTLASRLAVALAGRADVPPPVGR